ncbi:galactoside alpha-(1,2)-fucosyltransferase 2-like [Physella acuta]|uniref:galactoside alpha-(1,2)-fucosyltransferase 2-like n=1 Tax=Physella acuta TaxID=109671 RepID=UPI0027DE0E54|nr:galactoside alpha-(1,2)-fucosyltransferase 2-like [Physella acuta]XP_059156964.1 galactoside alpha-(1,2)-fucosyltransferase 2-like [Physella acuta]XP_059156973.1 galactoside alpha-(1,2)-fucosyltransferase 2-like [Physella acuta]
MVQIRSRRVNLVAIFILSLVFALVFCFSVLARFSTFNVHPITIVREKISEGIRVIYYKPEVSSASSSPEVHTEGAITTSELSSSHGDKSTGQTSLLSSSNSDTSSSVISSSLTSTSLKSSSGASSDGSQRTIRIERSSFVIPMFSSTDTRTSTELKTSTMLKTTDNVTSGEPANTSAAPKLMLTIDHDVGRMGNKMFKYAALLGVAHETGRVPVVNPYTADIDMLKVFQLTHVGSYPEASTWTSVTETQYGYCDPVFQKLPPQNVHMRGYVQSWKYFQNITDVIRKEFTFLPNIQKRVNEIKDEIREQYKKPKLVFVGVHVRMRDGYSNPVTCEAPKSFFTNAFNKMKALLPGKDLVFIIAGNNLKWCAENLNYTDVVLLKDAPPEIHFATLASCDHGIVTVGTFGWWSSWLTGGLVIFYKKFPLPNSYEFQGFVYDDYYPPSWFPVDD